MIIFYATYALAWILLFVAPDVPILEGSATTNPIPLSTFCLLYIIGGGYWWLRHHRNHPIIGPIYRIVQMFFIVLFATLFANYAKKEIKEWWNKDQCVCINVQHKQHRRHQGCNSNSCLLLYSVLMLMTQWQS